MICQASQRGVDCTVKLVEQLLAGLEVPPTGHITVVDLIYNRWAFTHHLISALIAACRSTFNEMGKAMWALQKRALMEPNKQCIDWRFYAASTSEDIDLVDIEQRRQSIAGDIRAVTNLTSS